MLGLTAMGRCGAVSDLLTVASVLTCPHGGALALATSNVSLECGDGFALVESDVHAVVGCPFTLPGPKASPCVKVSWSGGSASLDADGVAVLTRASVGRCESAEGAPQGSALVVSTQGDVTDD
ncbi:MAG: hypothetical protein U0324_33990 [Polyangiales bacterium]